MILKCSFIKDGLSINDDPGRNKEFLLSFVSRIGIDGKDAYTLWIEQGNTGTVDEFIAWMQKPAVDAAQIATTASGNADRAAGAAGQAAELADTSRENLTEAVAQKLTQVDQTMTAVDRAVGTAVSATVEASNIATSAADQAARDAEAARHAASGANTAAGTATTAATTANANAQEAAKQANKATTAATLAEQKATLAATAATNADTATGKANTAAKGADTAAEHATEVAAGIDGRMTAAEAEMFQLRTVELPLKADITPATGATSALRALFVARGAVWNEKTGFYELNGLTDISEREIIEIYDWSSNWLINRLPNLALLTYNFALCPCRTIFPYRKQNSSQFLCGSTVSLAGMFFFSSLNIIPIHAVDRLINDDIGSVYVYSLDYTFYNCSLLDRVIGVINCQSLTGFNNAFINCRKLRELKLLKLTCSVSLQNSPLLERMYILYMINNAANTTPITLTLHTDAAARLTAEDIALASLKNITIA